MNFQIFIIMTLQYFISSSFTSDTVNCDVDDGCHANATCTDGNGSYICVCNGGFTGDGFNCTGNDYILHLPYSG